MAASEPASMPAPEVAGTDAAQRYATVREASVALIAPLSAEDACVQSMPDASPAKWHLAHVTWFFETFVLERYETSFRPYHPAFRELFNSYYNGIGPQYPRAQRRSPGRARRGHGPPSGDRRAHAGTARAGRCRPLALGLAHEEQHQELLLMDLKHLLSGNP